jgi:hypothetical protein
MRLNKRYLADLEAEGVDTPLEFIEYVARQGAYPELMRCYALRRAQDKFEITDELRAWLRGRSGLESNKVTNTLMGQTQKMFPALNLRKKYATCPNCHGTMTITRNWGGQQHSYACRRCTSGKILTWVYEDDK